MIARANTHAVRFMHRSTILTKAGMVWVEALQAFTPAAAARAVGRRHLRRCSAKCHRLDLLGRRQRCDRRGGGRTGGRLSTIGCRLARAGAVGGGRSGVHTAVPLLVCRHLQAGGRAERKACRCTGMATPCLSTPRSNVIRWGRLHPWKVVIERAGDQRSRLCTTGGQQEILPERIYVSLAAWSPLKAKRRRSHL